MNESQRSYDIIFIGAGIATGATLFHLLEAAPDLRVLVLERLNFFGQEATGKSASAVRNIFSSTVNRQLAHASIQAYKEIDRELRGSDDFPDGIQLALHGYLWLFDRANWDRLRPVVTEMRNEEKVTLLSVDEVAQRFLPGFSPRVSEELRGLSLRDILAEAEEVPGSLSSLADEKAYLDDVVQGVFGDECGYLDPTALANYYFARATAHPNVTIRYRTRVEEILEEGGRVAGVRVARAQGQETISAGRVVVGAGAYARDFLQPLDLAHLVQPTNRMLFTFSGEGVRNLFAPGGKRRPFPLVAFYHRAYFRPDADNAMVGRSGNLTPPPPVPEDDPPPYQQWADDAYFSHVVQPLLAEHLPAFRRGILQGHGCGLYAYTPDRTPLIGPLPGPEGLSIVGGFSGSGIMKAHAAGSVMAAWLLNGGSRCRVGSEEIDMEALSPARFVSGRELPQERFVI